MPDRLDPFSDAVQHAIDRLHRGRVPLRARRLRLPRRDPMSRVPIGEATARGGVAFARHRPGAALDAVRPGGAPGGPGVHGPGVGASTAAITAAVEHEAAEAARRFSAAMGARAGRALTQAYTTAAVEAAHHRQRLLDRTLSVSEARGHMAGTLARGLAAEMGAMADSDAQRSRYRGWTGARPLGPAVVARLQAGIERDLLAGGYFARRHARVEAEQRVLTQGSRVERQRFREGEHRLRLRQSLWDLFGVDPPADDAADDTPPDWQGPLEVYDFEARVYSAEHPVLGDEPTAMLEGEGIPLTALGLNHCSAIAGIWCKLRRAVRRGGVEGTEYTEEGQWVVANGSASWLLSSDDLILKARRSFESHEAALRWIRGVLPTDHGNHTAHRSCSYSVGVYGINWVCHSNSNAFALRRNWVDTLVDYPLVGLLFFKYGTYPITNQQGHYGVSKKNCPWWGDDKPGGVPGAFLHYHVAWPYIAGGAGDPVDQTFNMGLAMALQAGMALTDGGAGWGLGTYWNGSAHVASGVVYNPRTIPIDPPALPAFTETK